MNVIHLATNAASMKGWPSQRDMGGDLKIEIPTSAGRTQVVNVTMARDGDGDPAAFVWSKAADMSAIHDPWGMLQLNAKLTYGRVAIRGQDVLILHSMLDASADLAEVGKALFWVAKAADDLEQQSYGAYHDVL